MDEKVITEKYSLYLGNCLDILPTISDKSVDAVITDLPYGTTACKWDVIIPLNEMWKQVNRICKGVFVTTTSQPFTSILVSSNIEQFKEELIWDKEIPSGMSYARFMHMRQHENIVVFSKGRMTYNPQETIRDKPIKNGGNKFSEVAPIMARKTNKSFSKIYLTKQPTTIISVKKIRSGSEHPTQKPTALYEYLIKTYTNKDEIVLDIAMGSGTTGVSCMKTGRKFIGIELKEEYYVRSQKRIKEQSEKIMMFME